MAIKTGVTVEEIKKRREENLSSLSKIMERYDVVSMTDKYAENVAQITPEVLAGDKDKDKVTANLNKFIEDSKEKVVELRLDDLSDSPKNCYSKMEGEKKEEFIASLKSFGQINPIIVRPKECVEDYQDLIEKDFEILVGHTRVSCLKEIGNETVKAIIIDCNDVDATRLIAQSNIQREKVTELELARAYKNTYDALKKDKGGNDKVLKGRAMRQAQEQKAVSVENTEVLPSGQNDHLDGSGRRTRDIVAEMYGISGRTLERKMALAECIDDVVDLYLKKKITHQQMEYISKASASAQESMCEVLKDRKEGKLHMTDDIAKAVWRASEEEIRHPSGLAEFPLNTMRKVIREGQIPDDGSKAAKKAEKVLKLKAAEGLYKVKDAVFPSSIKDTKEREAFLTTAAEHYVEYLRQHQEEYTN